jgi:hypothetical protein
MLISLALLLLITACGQSPQKATIKNTGPIDLSKLLLTENTLGMMTSQGIKRETKDSLDKTLFGLEVFKSSDPKAMHFGGEDFSGQTGKDRNYVLFHYHENSDSLAFYELNVYTKPQTNALISQLEKHFGKPIFQKVGTQDGDYDLDEKGNMVKPKPDDNYAYRVWLNKQTGITYFLLSNGHSVQIKTQLTALKRSEQSGKDWVSLQFLDWFEK